MAREQDLPTYEVRRQIDKRLREVDIMSKAPAKGIQSATDFMAMLEALYEMTYDEPLATVTMDDPMTNDPENIETPYLVFDYNEHRVDAKTQAGSGRFNEVKPMFREHLYSDRQKEAYFERRGQFIGSDLTIKVIGSTKKETYEVKDRVWAITETFRDIFNKNGCRSYWVKTERSRPIDESVSPDKSNNRRLFKIHMNYSLILEKNVYISRDTIKYIVTNLIGIDRQDVVDINNGVETVESIAAEKIADGSNVFNIHSQQLGPITTNYTEKEQ